MMYGQIFASVWICVGLGYVSGDQPDYPVKVQSQHTAQITGNFTASVKDGLANHLPNRYTNVNVPLNDWQPRPLTSGQPNGHPTGYPTGNQYPNRDQAKDAAEEEQDAQESDDDHNGSDNEDNSDSKSSESSESANNEEENNEAGQNEEEQGGGSNKEGGNGNSGNGPSARVPEIGPLPDPVSAQLSAMFGSPVQRAALIAAVPVAQPLIACGITCNKISSKLYLSDNSASKSYPTKPEKIQQPAENYASQLRPSSPGDLQYDMSMQHQNIRAAVVPFYPPIGHSYTNLVKTAQQTRPLSENTIEKTEKPIPVKTYAQGANKFQKQKQAVPEIHINFSVMKPLGAGQMLGTPLNRGPMYPPVNYPVNFHSQPQPLSVNPPKEALAVMPNMNNINNPKPVAETNMNVRDSDDSNSDSSSGPKMPAENQENRTDPLNALHFDAVPLQYGGRQERSVERRGVVFPSKAKTRTAEVSASLEVKPIKTGNVISPRDRLKPKVTAHAKRHRISASGRTGSAGARDDAPVTKYFRMQGKYSFPG
ncbi:uncharacterized protein LOC129599819 [Paramacrobiotus metropolitanus]|uniref:uncharacterized protein LOC129599819 n=1 Tax=Paramacrobiotus metropolitanus TaxID=2943436 RepID=UPI0024462059|nr:uncharacterized protein LOC129599819 [Paramacrobiotus metropolitanus]